MQQAILTTFRSDVSGVIRGLNTVETRLGRFQSSVDQRLRRYDQRWERSANAVRRFASVTVAALGTTALTSFARSAVDTARTFEASMKAVQASGNLASDTVDQLAERARELGATTRFSATEAAGAIEVLIKNGLSVERILGGALDASLAMSAALGGPLAGAADLATDAMTTFGLSASDLEKVTDRLSGAAVSSKFGFNDLRLAIAQSAGVAGPAVKDFTDYVAAISAIAPAFSSGSDAGTSFRTFLQRLTPQSKEAASLMEQLGFSAFDAQGNFKDFPGIVGNLRTSFADLSEEARADALGTIFGTDAIRAAIRLIDTGADGFDRLKTSIEAISAADQAETRLEGLNGALARLNSAYQELQLQLADGGALESAVGAVEGFINALSAVAPFLDEIGTGVALLIGARGFAALSGVMQQTAASQRALIATRQADVAQSAARLASLQAETTQRVALLDTARREGQSVRQVTRLRTQAQKAIARQAEESRNYISVVGNLERTQSVAAASVTRMTTAVRGLGRSVVGLLGGPAGLAFLAVTLLPQLIGGSQSFAEQVDAATGAVSRLQNANRNLAQTEQQLTTAKQNLLANTEALTRAIASEGETAILAARAKVSASNAEIAALQQVRDARKELQRVAVREAEISLGTATETLLGDDRVETRTRQIIAPLRRDALRGEQDRQRRQAEARANDDVQALEAIENERTEATRQYRLAVENAKTDALEAVINDILKNVETATEDELEIVRRSRQLQEARGLFNLASEPLAQAQTIKPVTIPVAAANTPAVIPVATAENVEVIEATTAAVEELAQAEQQQLAIAESRLAVIEDETRRQDELRAAVDARISGLDDELVLAERRTEAAKQGEEALRRFDLEQRAAAESASILAQAQAAGVALSDEQRASIDRVTLALEEQRAAARNAARPVADTPSADSAADAETDTFTQPELIDALSVSNEEAKASTEALRESLQGIPSDLAKVRNSSDALDLLKNKALEVAETLLDIASRNLFENAFSGGGAGGGFGGGGGGILGSVLGGIGSIFGFADGGRVSGPGGPRDDRILARLSNGEFVVNAKSARQHAALLEAINSNRLPRFMDGGFVSPAMPALPTSSLTNNSNRSVAVDARTTVTLERGGEDERRALLNVLDQRDARLRAEIPALVSQRHRNDPGYLG